MKATDFNLQKDIRFNLDTGITTFQQSRLVIFDTNAIGLLRQYLIRDFGMEKARNLFLKFGFQNGYADFMQTKINYKFDTEMDLLASGPVVHTWEGIVHATPIEIVLDRKAGRLKFISMWRNSYEAEQHLTFNDLHTEPICWSLVGYASGWSTAFWEEPAICIEYLCVGKGDDHCESMIKPLKEWGPEVEPYLAAYEDFFKQMFPGTV